VTLIKEAQQFKANLQAVFVINRKIVNTVIGRDVTKALANFDLQVCDHALNQRVVYAESAARGLAQRGKASPSLRSSGCPSRRFTRICRASLATTTW
jgi:hypothetical protein